MRPRDSAGLQFYTMACATCALVAKEILRENPVADLDPVDVSVQRSGWGSGGMVCEEHEAIRDAHAIASGWSGADGERVLFKHDTLEQIYAAKWKQ